MDGDGEAPISSFIMAWLGLLDESHKANVDYFCYSLCAMECVAVMFCAEQQWTAAAPVLASVRASEDVALHQSPAACILCYGRHGKKGRLLLLGSVSRLDRIRDHGKTG